VHIGVGSGAAGAALAAPIFWLVAVLGPPFFFDTRFVCFITQTQKIAYRVVHVSIFQWFDNYWPMLLAIDSCVDFIALVYWPGMLYWEKLLKQHCGLAVWCEHDKLPMFIKRPYVGMNVTNVVNEVVGNRDSRLSTSSLETCYIQLNMRNN